MKMMKLAKPIILGIALGLAAGCKGTKPPVTQVPGGGGITGETSGIGDAVKITDSSSAASAEKAIEQGLPASHGHPGWTQNREALQADTVHFDYDKSTIRTDEKPRVAAVADYLKGNSAVAVLIEGHC